MKPLNKSIRILESNNSNKDHPQKFSIFQSIESQVKKLRCNMETPCSVYINLKGAEELFRSFDFVGYRPGTKQKYAQYMGLNVIVDDDFREPVVRPGAYVR